jgi:hypothetical protein
MLSEATMGDNFHGIDELFNFYERIAPDMFSSQEEELRSISARIPLGSFEYLGKLAENWGMSRSALAALLVQTALNEIELRQSQQEQQLEREKAQRAAL